MSKMYPLEALKGPYTNLNVRHDQREHRALRAATLAPTLDTDATPRRLRTPCGDATIEFVPFGHPTRSQAPSTFKLAFAIY